jgi:GT2 family glycosyltransferase
MPQDAGESHAEAERDDTTRVVVLLATHNRAPTTLSCLEALDAQQVDAAVVDVVVCDAGSTDGTPEEIRARFPRAVVLHGSSDLYWNAGMRVAFRHAVQDDYDFYLWLNDDTLLDPGALSTLLTTHAQLDAKHRERSAVVGAVRDPVTGLLTYGGVVRTSRLRPLRFELVAPTDEPVEVDTMNGNCVLLPRAVVSAVGLLDPSFTHSMGDFDYGLRIRSAGGSVWLAPATVGVCARNPTPPPAASLSEHFERLSAPKGLPPGEWAHFARRWGGPLWPAYAISPFVRRTLAWVRGAKQRREARMSQTR